MKYKPNKAHLRRVADLPCVVCERPSEYPPHHCKGYEFGCGGSLKASDEATIPLCPECHREFHRGQKTWEAKHGFQRDHLARTLEILGIRESNNG